MSSEPVPGLTRQVVEEGTQAFMDNLVEQSPTLVMQMAGSTHLSRAVSSSVAAALIAAAPLIVAEEHLRMTIAAVAQESTTKERTQ